MLCWGQRISQHPSARRSSRCVKTPWMMGGTWLKWIWINVYIYIYISRIHTRLCVCVYTCVMKNGIIKLGLCQQKHDFSMLVLWYFPIRLLRCHSTCWANAAVWHDFLQFVASNFRIRNYRVESASPESTSKRSDQRRRISVKDDPGSTSCINGRDEGFFRVLSGFL